jgi:hypothetical protein
MSERVYNINGYRVRFADNDETIGCLCTFPYNDRHDGKLIIGYERLINLALLGCAVVALTDGSIQEDLFLPYEMEEYLEAIEATLEKGKLRGYVGER